jgi:hypothetical protein
LTFGGFVWLLGLGVGFKVMVGDFGVLGLGWFFGIWVGFLGFGLVLDVGGFSGFGLDFVPGVRVVKNRPTCF